MGAYLEPHAIPEGPSTPALDLLNPRRRAFVLQYVLGDEGVRGVIYKSYLAAGYEAKNVNTAGAAGYQLLQDNLVKKAIEELRAEIERTAKGRMRSWVDMAVKVQTVMERAVDTALEPVPTPEEQEIMKLTGESIPRAGRLRDGRPRTFITTNEIALFREILDRALGRPKQPHTHDIGDRLDTLIKRLSSQDSPAALAAGSDPNFLGVVEDGELVRPYPQEDEDNG